MDDARSIAQVRERLAAERARGARIALVPTMGALHDGHLALVDAARRRADCVVMSVFVNPLQFGPEEDLARYPRDLPRDRALAAARGVDVLFIPGVEEMYRADTGTRVIAGEAATRWEGAVRPGHFDGVLTVVAKLLHIVGPAVSVFGQKDIQQVTLVRSMIRDLDFPVELDVVPTIREADGLAMSSRNVYLSASERSEALVLYRALEAARAASLRGETDGAAVRAVVEAALRTAPGVRADYIAVVDPERLAPVDRAVPGTIVALAARVGTTRLIDNVIL
ncbi:MAG TPA: pantoate--beta-alanine ligase [Gemmatimonadales bacterium]|jgi:pantoate--beta-alanine ligase